MALGVVQAAGEDHGRVQLPHETRGKAVVGDTFVVDGGRARMKGDRRDARLAHEAMGKLRSRLCPRGAGRSAA